MIISNKGSDKILNYLIYIALIFMFLITAIPLVNLVAVSLSSSSPIMRGEVTLLPVDFNIEPFKYVFSSKLFISSIRISAIISVVGSILGVFLSVTAAYVLSKKSLPGRKVLILAFVFTTMFNGGLIPSYMLVNKLGLLNSAWSMILPSVINVFNILIAKSFFEGIPEEIEESAKLDGASYTKILVRIMLPIAVPLIAVLILFFAVDFWNEYINAKMYITNPKKMPLQLYLRTAIFDSIDATEFDGSNMDKLNRTNTTNALIIASMIPVAILYPFIQRFFISGITIGSVKG